MIDAQVARPRMIASRRQVQTRADAFLGSPTNLVCHGSPSPFVPRSTLNTDADTL